LTETVAYKETGQIGEIEFRKYPEHVLATVNHPGEDSAFSYLFAYITGKNRPQGKIPMTAPVIISEQIQMTAPVISGEQSMSFVMPAGKSLAEMPEPLDEHVQLSSSPERDRGDPVQRICPTEKSEGNEDPTTGWPEKCRY